MDATTASGNMFDLNVFDQIGWTDEGDARGVPERIKYDNFIFERFCPIVRKYRGVRVYIRHTHRVFDTNRLRLII